MSKNHNPNCDGDHCLQPTGEVRVLAYGGGGNLILCLTCYRYEIAWRRARNRELGEAAQWSLPTWASLDVYGGTQ